MLEITSMQNLRIKSLNRLKKRRERDESGLFIIEGYREISRALGRYEIESLFISPELYLGENEDGLVKQVKKEAEIIQLAPFIFEKISFRDRPDGLCAIAKQRPQKLAELPQSENPFLLIAESIEKPGNLGSILRSCDAAGVDGLIVCDRCTDSYNPNVIRASVGTRFTQPVVDATSQETLEYLQEKKIQILAATPSAKQSYTDAHLSGPIALVVGSEQLGLSELWMKEADIQVRIPMLGVADSLNVAAATTLLLYETLRQRS